MQELKACPFCGGPGRITLRSIGTDGRSDRFMEEYEVGCVQCGATTGKIHQSRFFRKNGEFIMEKDGYAEAVAGWNRRAETPPNEETPPEGQGGS